MNIHYVKNPFFVYHRKKCCPFCYNKKGINLDHVQVSCISKFVVDSWFQMSPVKVSENEILYLPKYAKVFHIQICAYGTQKLEKAEDIQILYQESKNHYEKLTKKISRKKINSGFQSKDIVISKNTKIVASYKGVEKVSKIVDVVISYVIHTDFFKKNPVKPSECK